ncbi:MAG: hypothetical protein WC519_03075 [Parcubacteria group bacterium]
MRANVKLPFTLTLVPVGFDIDKTKDGWKLLENEASDIPAKIGRLRLELAEVFYRNESHISGEQLRMRAKYLRANHGQRLAELLLRNQSQIPKEWGKYSLVFPGTIWQDLQGHQIIPFMYCNYMGDERWSLGFGHLNRDWDDASPFIHFVLFSE